MENNVNLYRTLLGIAAVIIILAGVKLAAEIVEPFLLALFIAQLYSEYRFDHCCHSYYRTGTIIEWFRYWYGSWRDCYQYG
ncbi:hypothetical protein BKG93_04170 [Rodentibacter ratti]|uniref:Uncharacterized protein n=1 Tax=Rodentibacter ratti TaxID=1906745 RepID=A0A1V3L7S2_9PAST|nr:hypothetical protein [Rodentibacter ratti]OOF85881.1 hypothetical protein BKG93_04170 [Rodentibacter ratti]